MVTGLSISSGSIGGGYPLVISGYNFSPRDSSNNVIIGGQFCSIVHISETEITCTVPAMSLTYTPGI